MAPLQDTANPVLEGEHATHLAAATAPGRLTQAVGALLLLLLLGFGVVQVIREPRFTFTSTDAYIYSIAARMWSNGAVPYRDFIDHKPPLIYAFLRLCYWVSDSPRAVFQGVDVLIVASAMALFSGLWIAGRRPLAIGASLAYVVFDSADPLGMRHENTEHLAMTGVTLAFALGLVYRTRRRLVWPFLSGLALALGVLGKQPAALFAAPLAILLLDFGPEPLRVRMRRALLPCAVFALGVLVVVAVVVAYFAAHRAVGPMIEWTYLRNLDYAQASEMHNRWVTMRGALRYLVQCIGERALFFPYALGLVALPVALVLRRTRLEVVTVLLVLAGLAAVSLGIQFYTHYLTFFQLGFAMAFGVALDLLLAIPALVRRPALGVVAAAVVCSIVFAPHARAVRKDLAEYDEGAIYRHMQTDPAALLGRRIRRAAAPGDRLVQVGDPMAVAFYSGLLPAGRYPYLYANFLGPDYLADMRSTRPKFIFAGSQIINALERSEADAWPGLRATLATSYDLWIDDQCGRLYRRRN